MYSGKLRIGAGERERERERERGAVRGRRVTP